MSVGKWEPFRNISLLQDRINRMFEEAFTTKQRMDEELSLCAWKPNVDIFETDAGTVLRADLPGVDKAHIQLEIKDNVLTLHGERPPDSDVTEDRYYRKERCCGTFQRSFRLQWPVDPAAVSARFKDGVLDIRIPRPETEKPRRVNIDIE